MFVSELQQGCVHTVVGILGRGGWSGWDGSVGGVVTEEIGGSVEQGIGEFLYCFSAHGFAVEDSGVVKGAAHFAAGDSALFG